MTTTTETPDVTTGVGETTALQTIKADGLALRARIEAIEIKSEEENLLAIETGKIIATLTKKLETERKRLVDPLNAQVKEINSSFKPYSDALEGLQATLKKKLVMWAEEKERLAREKAERQRRAMEELRKKELEEASKAGIEAAPALVLPVKEAEKTVHSDTGSATAGKRWTFEIVDANAIPRQYLKVDEPSIRAAIRDGAREIPGVRIYQETSISIR
jgi:hypothetical protein